MPSTRWFALGGSLATLVVACSTTPTSTDWNDASADASTTAGTAAGGSESGGASLTTRAGASAGTVAGGSPSGGQNGGNGGSAVISKECPATATATIGISWNAANKQPAAFYATDAARTLADNVLYYQNADRGWPKNIDMSTRAAPKEGSTIDNRATTTQIEYLARVYAATSCGQYGAAAIGGIEFLLEAQYENGGWPQIYPNPNSYRKHITFNDDAMIHVLQVLRAIATGAAPYTFVDDTLKSTASAAVKAGIDCILACQIQMRDGQRGWCAQHDEKTLKPAQARTYELPSVSGSEGAVIARFLMTIEPPTPEIRAAVKGAIAWFEASQIKGIRIDKTVDASQPTGEDRVVVADPTAPPIWARFYELETNEPIFSSRCEVPECDSDPFFMRRYSLAEIDNERRVGYLWYGDWPAAAIRDYQAWIKKYPD